MTNPDGITAWQGDWGTYEVSARFDPLRIRVNGWPDKRQTALYAEFMVWVGEQERAAMGKMPDRHGFEPFEYTERS